MEFLTIREAVEKCTALGQPKSAFIIGYALRQGFLLGWSVQGAKRKEWRTSTAALEQWLAGYAPDGSMQVSALAKTEKVSRQWMYTLLKQHHITLSRIGKVEYVTPVGVAELRRKRRPKQPKS